jgi:excinuclease ABC subunit C
LKEKLARVPDAPGVYLYRNSDGDVIYVGKAKSLRKRVHSYFRASAGHSARISRMVAEIADLDVIVVGTEMEALILESNLIKRELPRYNVLLRDDKQFPYLKFTLGDTYPRVALVRETRQDRSQYIGPFVPQSGARKTLKVIQQHFRVATCKERFDGKRRPCLYFHLDQCLAPCAGKTDPDTYGRAVGDARLFLQGRDRELMTSLRKRMHAASGARRYEEAARHRDTLKAIENLGSRQRVSSAGQEERDYLAHHAEGQQVSLQLFQMREGRIQSRREFNFSEIDFEPATFYGAVLVQYYMETVPPAELCLPVVPAGQHLIEQWLSERRGGRVTLRVPQRGSQLKLLSLVRQNARFAFESRFRGPQTVGSRSLEALAELLGMAEPPFRIECFDISNVQGTDSVASMVVWEGGKPLKSDYRSFNIKTVEGADDYASIAEAVTRRYRRRLAEGARLPDLVLIDGGRGQLSAAVTSVTALTREGLPMLTVASIAKREEEIYLEHRDQPIRADRSSPALQLLQRIRDEAHRFALSKHRQRRAKRTLRTDLTEIRGIGKITAAKLLREFGSLEGVRGAAREELERVAGRTVAEAIRVRYGE